jgi:carbon-monoxide dehydrogenase medium subunit
VGCLVALDGAGRIVRAAVALVGVGPVALRLTVAERALVGESPGPELFRAAASACEPLEAMSDTQASGAYRRTVAGVLTRRALELATRRAAALNA